MEDAWIPGSLTTLLENCTDNGPAGLEEDERHSPLLDSPLMGRMEPNKPILQHLGLLWGQSLFLLLSVLISPYSYHHAPHKDRGWGVA